MEPSLTESDDPDDNKDLPVAIGEQVAKIKAHTPPEKTEQVVERLETLLGEFKNPTLNYGVNGMVERLKGLEEVVLFFVASQEAFQENFLSLISKANLKLLLDGFAQRCDLRVATMTDLIEVREEVESKFMLILETKREIDDIMGRSNGKMQFEDLMRRWKAQEISIDDLHQELQKRFEKASKTRETQHQAEQRKRDQAVNQVQTCLVYTEKQKIERLKRLQTLEGAKLDKAIIKIETEIPQREEEARVYYQSQVEPLIATDPQNARREVRKMRRRFGYGVYTFLDIEALPATLNDIDRLQREEAALERRQARLSAEGADLEKQRMAIYERLKTLTGQKTFKFSEAIAVKDEKTSEASEMEEPSTEVETVTEIEKQIHALEKTEQVIRGPWMKEALKCRPVESKELIGEEYTQELMEKEEVYGRDDRVAFLMNHQDTEGENLWTKCQRLEAQCPYDIARDQSYTEHNFYTRVIGLDLADFSGKKAQALEHQMDQYLSGPHELIFFAALFKINPHHQKFKPASSVTDTLVAIQEKKRLLREQKSKVDGPSTLKRKEPRVHAPKHLAA